MIFGLLALAIMLIGAAAMIRSVNSSLFSAGNLGFKRDLANQSERAAAKVLAEFSAGGALAAATARIADNPAFNYSASFLPANAQGIPEALLNPANFAGVGIPANDIVVTDTNGTTVATVRYVVDRLCTEEGPVVNEKCVKYFGSTSPTRGVAATKRLRADDVRREGTAGAGTGGAIPTQYIYRISVKVTGPRNTESFYQTSFTR